MGKIARLPGMEYMSGSEYKAFIKEERKAYRRRLRMIYPSKEMRQTADSLADGDESCANCYYYNKGGGSEMCRVPYTNAYRAALNIDPCYEGILVRLCKEMERERRQGESGDELKIMRSRAYDTLETIDTIARVMINVAEKNETIPPVMAQCLRSISETAREIMKDWKSTDGDEYEFEDDEWDFDIDDDEGSM